MSGRNWWVGVVALAAVGPAAAQPPTRLETGHTDLVVEYAGGWRGVARTNTTSYQWDRTILMVRPNVPTLFTRPAGPQFDFMGGSAGDTIYRLRQTSSPGQLFLGTSSEGMGPPPAGAWAAWQPAGLPVPAQWIAYTVTGVRRPTGGEFSVWQDNTFGPDRLVSTARPGDTLFGNTLYDEIGGHSHFNWAFTLPGTYEVDIVASTRYTTGSETITLTSDSDPLVVGNQPFTFTFEVVPIPEPATVLAVAGAGLGLAAAVRRRRKS